MSEILLADSTRAKLMPLKFNPRKIRIGGTKGERRSSRRGTSIEFADYRNYVAGDDLRKLDWNALARLDRPIVKLYEDEEDLTVYVLVDTSASMGNLIEDTPENDKLLFAKKVASALAFIALNSNDKLVLSTLNSNPFRGRGRGQIVPMLQYLSELKAEGVNNLNTDMKNFSLREKQSGMVFLITDLFNPEGYTEALNHLQGRGHEVVLIHTLAPQELNPTLVGDLRLIDVELGTAQELTIDVQLQAHYQQMLQAWLSEIRLTCQQRNIPYFMISTDTVPEQIVIQELRRRGVVC
jgi:uncharacterized protein (DUF58 family)